MSGHRMPFTNFQSPSYVPYELREASASSDAPTESTWPSFTSFIHDHGAPPREEPKVVGVPMSLDFEDGRGESAEPDEESVSGQYEDDQHEEVVYDESDDGMSIISDLTDVTSIYESIETETVECKPEGTASPTPPASPPQTNPTPTVTKQPWYQREKDFVRMYIGLRHMEANEGQAQVVPVIMNWHYITRTFNNTFVNVVFGKGIGARARTPRTWRQIWMWARRDQQCCQYMEKRVLSRAVGFRPKP